MVQGSHRACSESTRASSEECQDSPRARGSAATSWDDTEEAAAVRGQGSGERSKRGGDASLEQAEHVLGLLSEAPSVFRRLNSKAEPWQPRSMAVVPAVCALPIVMRQPRQGPSNCRYKFGAKAARVATAVANAALKSGVCPDVQLGLSKKGEGWLIDAVVSGEARCMVVDGVLEVAKAALLQAADQEAPGLWVLGYRGSPFAAIKRGFRVHLGSMADGAQDQACWDLYRLGRCCRGVACRWDHPNFVHKLTVRVHLVK